MQRIPRGASRPTAGMSTGHEQGRDGHKMCGTPAFWMGMEKAGVWMRRDRIWDLLSEEKVARLQG